MLVVINLSRYLLLAQTTSLVEIVGINSNIVILVHSQVVYLHVKVQMKERKAINGLICSIPCPSLGWVSISSKLLYLVPGIGNCTQPGTEVSKFLKVPSSPPFVCLPPVYPPACPPAFLNLRRLPPSVRSMSALLSASTISSFIYHRTKATRAASEKVRLEGGPGQERR